MKNYILYLIPLLLISFSCIQDDIIELGPESTTITIKKENNEIIGIDGQIQMSAQYVEANKKFEEAVFKWVSEDPSIATIDNNGLIKGKSQGTTNVYATAYGFSSKKEIIQVVSDTSAIFEVEISTPKNAILLSETITLLAEGKNINGNATTGSSITWQSLKTNVATINSSTGVIAPLSTGNATFTATIDGVTSNVITIAIGSDANAAATIEIKNGNPTMTTNDMQQLSAEVKNFAGEVMTNLTISWESSQTDLATISEQGSVTALSAGTVTITASYDNISTTYEISIVDKQTRTGSLKSTNYTTEGDFELELTTDNKLKLHFTNFNTPDALRLPGVIIYLANTLTDASSAKANGLRVGKVPQVDGSFTMDVPSLDPAADYSKYSSVFIMCEPFTLSMGTGALD